MECKDRPSRDSVLMGTVELWAARSTCSRGALGALITFENRIISTGYNGAPMGMPHCEHHCTCRPGGLGLPTGHFEGCPSQQPCKVAVHAEANAIAFAARHGVGTEGATIWCSQSPCVPCAQLIINSGIREVVYVKRYRDPAGVELCQEAGLTVRLPQR